MFTGLIEAIGTIASCTPTAGGLAVRIRGHLPGEPLVLGESVACSGPCLTVSVIHEDGFEVEISHETTSRTTWGQLSVGDEVHLERAMKLGARLGGHLVTGHVDERGTLLHREDRGDNVGLRFSAGPKVLPYLVEKGCVSIDGVSLTVNSVADHSFEVNIVPHTVRSTLLAEMRVGTVVNLEGDMIGKYVERLMQGRLGQSGGSAVDMDLLKRHGFA